MSKLSLSRVVKPYLKSLDCPRALTVWIMLTNNEHDQLVNLDCIPSQYANMESFQSAYRATGLLAKYPKMSVSAQPEKVALTAFRDAEDQCRLTNTSIRSWAKGVSSFHPATPWVIHEARKMIEKVLGQNPLSSVWRRKTFEDGFTWGPGSTSAVGGRSVSLADKLEVQPECTASLNHLVSADHLLTLIPNWYFSHRVGGPIGSSDFLVAPYRQDVDTVKCTIVHGNKVTFVPKNAKTHRSIAIEPHLNVLAQKGIGNLIRGLMKRHGLDLNSSERNILLAQIGSKHGTYATVDLKAASDTISYEVVKLLLPEKWFGLLNAARSHRFSDPETGEWKYYQKFSSMGNGFTFELESLLFWALSVSACSYSDVVTDVAVFGDDIVCPTGAVSTLLPVLKDLGFVPNSGKTFTEGPFRESCGGDFYLGSPVTRFQMKEELSERELVVLHNKATTASLRPYGRDKVFAPFIFSIRAALVERGTSYGLGPYGLDGCLWADLDEAAPRFSKKHWKRYHRAYWRIRRETFKPAYAPARSILDLTARLWQNEKLPRPLNPWTKPISVSETAGRPLRGQGTWIFRDVCVADFPLMGSFH